MKNLKMFAKTLLFTMLVSGFVACTDDDETIQDLNNQVTETNNNNGNNSNNSNNNNNNGNNNNQTTATMLSEDFEGEIFPPENWAVFAGENGLGTDYEWKQLTLGNKNVAFIEFETLDNDSLRSEDWLVTPKVTITDDNKILSFNDAGQLALENTLGSEYTIRVSTTSQTEHSSFTIIDTKMEGEIAHLSNLLANKRKVDLSDYIGQEIYIAFVLEQNDSDNWFLDNVELVNN